MPAQPLLQGAVATGRVVECLSGEVLVVRTQCNIKRSFGVAIQGEASS